MGEIERPDADPRQLRVSDAERHEVAELLRTAAGDGRIDLQELDERLEATYAAKTYADLLPITSDLPAHRDAARPPAPRPAPASSQITPGGPREQRHLAIMSGLDRSGVWTVPERLTITCFMGGANLDLRQATYAAQEVVITVNAFMGGASIVVGPHTHVVIEGVGIMGGYSGPSGLVDPELDDSSPTVRVRGIAIWGGVSVERKPRPDPRPTRHHRLH
ncbi:DUF1707 domain-containing protein [Nocardioides sp. cx-169]|uniref:DUF1707 SHOCT-like domain-containing protein n=1 Tax=Nocardioides sp. cx-169 TaxID=2899080 RepID=UPI001E51DF61|nr:DUF1707 domain-containing protein [Nocardioides sp. cx-169]MCD4536100.1 DUF1707 domain-containing protein [Nocardioides sp. cx-169]